MDWMFTVIPVIIGVGFVYVIGNIIYSVVTGKNVNKIHSGRGSMSNPGDMTDRHNNMSNSGGGGGAD